MSASSRLQTAAFRAGRPEAGVYFVLPAWMASMAAFLMFSGVSKSGSPVPKLMTSLPSAFRRLASALTASVLDSWMADAFREKLFIGDPSMLLR